VAFPPSIISAARAAKSGVVSGLIFHRFVHTVNGVGGVAQWQNTTTFDLMLNALQATFTPVGGQTGNDANLVVSPEPGYIIGPMEGMLKRNVTNSSAVVNLDWQGRIVVPNGYYIKATDTFNGGVANLIDLMLFAYALVLGT